MDDVYGGIRTVFGRYVFGSQIERNSFVTIFRDEHIGIGAVGCNIRLLEPQIQ